MKKTLVTVVLCLALSVALTVPAPAQTGAKAAKPAAKAAPEARLTSELLTGLAFRSIGPAVMSGRISDIAIHPLHRHTWYVAVGSGGVWKTENAGTTWAPVFDAQPSYSIGCITLDPSNPETVWVGTGENVSGRHVGFGDGVYKSLNGGRTWTNVGLAKSEHIGRILVDPRDSNVVFVAAEGPLWSAGGERGLYKTADGGKTWTPVLEISKDTGVTSVEFDAANPDILYAAAYQRRRSVAAFMGGGPESGLYKSDDAGKTWRKLTVGLPKGDMGKIGLAVSPIDPRVVYATVEAGPEEKGFYRSADRGESWEKRNPYISGGTGPHYYQEIFADPNAFDRVYQMDPGLRATDDGGKTWRRVDETNKHGDNHAMAFVKGDPGYILNGSDGGVYETYDAAKTWRFFENLPVTQFYKLALDNAIPFYNVHGGAQDNGSQLGPSRTVNAHGISNADWLITYGADGYATAIDPEDPNTVYLEWQIGNLLRYDKKSHETVYISPRPEPGDPPLRFNWDSPVVISPHARTRLYYAGQFVWRSDDRGDSWTRVSPDLTRGIFRLEQKIMGRQWSADALWDHGAMSQFGTITSLSESRLAEGLIYAGTDDGLIQVTDDGGKTWRRIDKIAGVPDYFFVNEIMASKHDKDTVYAAVDIHKTSDYKPYLMMSADRGRTWTNIAGGLPQRTIVWSVAQDHVKKDLVFAGTEFGIYATIDGGKTWLKLGGGVPTISFRDIEVQERESDLVGASFGRSFFVLDDYGPLREMSEESLAKKAALFPVKKALQYVPLRPIDSDTKGCLGENYYTAPNPPFGAVFTYYLKDGVKSAAEARREAEAKLVKDGKDVPFPGWDALRKEENEEKPAVVLIVEDEAGQVVRRIAALAAKGLHRVAWNLRYPAVDPPQLETARRESWERDPVGPMVVPGRFTVTLAKVADGVITALAAPQTFVVESLNLASLPEKDKAALLGFQKKAGELQRAMMGAGAAAEDGLKNLKYIRKALLDAPKADPKLAETARAIEKRIQDELAVLFGDRTRGMRSEPAEPSLMDRVSAQLDATAPITAMARRGYEIAADGFEKLIEEMRQTIEVDLKKLQADLEAAGAPWTPGRGVPVWKKK
ncbi:MAG: glycosyl hydrolase [Candidatus Aminicenantes bacterium RBG_16_63_16]|nr:MAG: glycosyl hydrolase [Candidatus Aminicenantes bacterium RBG_16_63_16]